MHSETPRTTRDPEADSVASGPRGLGLGLAADAGRGMDRHSSQSVPQTSEPSATQPEQQQIWRSHARLDTNRHLQEPCQVHRPPCVPFFSRASTMALFLNRGKGGLRWATSLAHAMHMSR